MKAADEKRLASVPQNNEEYKKVAHSLRLCSCFANIQIKDIKRISTQGIDFDRFSNVCLIGILWKIE